MAHKYSKNRLVAKLVTENGQPCIFCQWDVDDEVTFGKLYSLGDIHCHYFCVLLSCCLVQKGRDSEGLFGFLYKDILAEVERSKKHRCSYCGRGGANLGCTVSTCRKQFHLPCGRQKNAVSMFYGNYKSFCERHAPKQKISDSVMVNARARMRREKMTKAGNVPVLNSEAKTEDESAMVCVICYEDVQGYPTTQTFWPPCCGRDAWLHRSCLQRMALSAGMHYLKCPLCNDKETFHKAVCDQGYYLPDRDAAWELEQNAFAEMYSRDVSCSADCKCPFGRTHDEPGIWDIKLCLLCGSWGAHAHCLAGDRAVCRACRPAAQDIELLETRISEVILSEQSREQRNSRRGPVMPSRMSLRRTKGRMQPHSSSSSTQNSSHDRTQVTEAQSHQLEEPKSRPKLVTPDLRELETRLLSPIKLLEQTYMEKGIGTDVVVSDEVIQKIRVKFSRPKPLSAKKKIVNEILDDLFQDVFKDSLKTKDLVKEWNSPKKSVEIAGDFGEKPKKIPEMKLNIDTVTGTSLGGVQTVINVDPETSKKECQDNKISESGACDEACNEIDIKNDLNDGFIKDVTAIDTAKHIEADNRTESSNILKTSELEGLIDSNTHTIVETPKREVDLTKDTSLEISEHDDVTNVDVVTGVDKENVNVNLTEGQSLNVEVNEESNSDHTKIKKNRKRKLDMKDEGGKRKKSKVKIKIRTGKKKDGRRVKKMKNNPNPRLLKLSFKNTYKSNSKAKKVQKVKTFKQYVLKYSPVQTDKVIAKPDVDISPIKRKCIKMEKSVDKLVQTSIQSFFKAK